MEGLPRLFHLLLFTFTSLNPSMTAPTSLLPGRRTHLKRIENPFSLFLGLPLFPSSLHPQAQCLHAIQKLIKQLQQHLKAAHLDRKTLQILALQFQNDFAVLRYLLLYSVGNISPHDNSVSHSTIQPANKPNLKRKVFNVTLGAVMKNMDKVIKLRQ